MKIKKLIVLTFIFSLSSCGLFKGELKKVNIFKSNSYVSQSIDYLREGKRVKPKEISSDFNYPLYDSNNSYSEEIKSQIHEENKALMASDTTYDMMDKDGNLYLNGQKTGKYLYKHPASKGMYYGDVPSSTLAYDTKVDINPRPLGNYITGVYAPAGEVIKIEVSSEDLKETGGFDIIIGQCSNRGHISNIDPLRNLNRMPYVTNKIRVKSEVTYVGNYFGGPIYVGEPTNKVPFSVTIKNGVKYPYLILGETTKERFEENVKSGAPYFDLEVFDDGVRHSGPYKMVEDLGYENLYKAARLWENFASVSNRIPSWSHAKVGIGFMYDPYVPIGAAVAYVGANFCNLPSSWMNSALNYDSFISEGSWGAIHEYNHHYQAYGIHPGDEVTNNAINLVEYALFTNISSKRTENGGLDGWNFLTDASLALKDLLKSSKETSEPISSLPLYATLMHEFGPSAFINAASNYPSSDASSFYKAMSEASKTDLTFYFNEVLHQKINIEDVNYIKSLNYPSYIPSASIYQTGNVYEGVETKSERPFNAPSSNFNIDLAKSLITLDGYEVKIKDIKEINGDIVLNEDKTYKVSLDKNNKAKFYLNLEVASNLNKYSKTMVIEFLDYSKQSYDLSLDDNAYKREYSFNGVNYSNSLVDGSLKNFTPWDDNYVIEKMFDGKKGTYMHSRNMINEENAFEIGLDLKASRKINYLRFNGYYMENNEHIPTSFKLYQGDSYEDMKLYKEYSDLQISAKSLKIDVDIKARYLKLEVTKTSSGKYIALDNIETGYYNEGKMLSPSSADYYGDLKLEGNKDAFFGNYFYFEKLKFQGNYKFVSLVTYSEVEREIEVKINNKTQKIKINKGFDLVVVYENKNQTKINIEITNSKKNVGLNYLVVN